MQSIHRRVHQRIWWVIGPIVLLVLMLALWYRGEGPTGDVQHDQAGATRTSVLDTLIK